MRYYLCDEEEYSSIVKDFMHQHGLHKIIAFSGGADSALQGVADEDPLQKQYKEFSAEMERRIISDIISLMKGYRIAVLTGGTKWGVPNTAATIAKENGIKTIGVFPKVGEKHALSDDVLDLSLCIHPVVGESCWGDEAPVFTKLLDGVIVYGGSSGTLVEVSHIFKMNEALLKHKGEHAMKQIVPLTGTGGVADGLPFIWSKPDVRVRCTPEKRIYTGQEAFNFLRDRLDLDDYFDPKLSQTQEEKK